MFSSNQVQEKTHVIFNPVNIWIIKTLISSAGTCVLCTNVQKLLENVPYISVHLYPGCMDARLHGKFVEYFAFVLYFYTAGFRSAPQKKIIIKENKSRT